MVSQNYLTIFLVVLSTISRTYAAQCNCHCPSFRGQLICENIENLWRVANTNTGKLVEWERYRPFVERFSERWKREIADIVEMKMEQYISEGRFYPKPENLVSKIEDGMQNDQSTISKPSKNGSDIVSNLLVKVERVENKTLEVEEELKSERRVRRDLEKEVKETQTSIISLGDQLQNVKVPVDTMMNEVQLVIDSSLEDMNRTIYEEHLKKLYYRIDGVVYKNETKKLDERLEHVEIELQNGDNSSIITKLAEEFKTLEENLNLLNNSIENTLVPRIDAINISIGNVLVPRIQTLESHKTASEELEDRMTDLLNNTEHFGTALVDVWSNIQDIQNFEKKFQNFSEQWSASLKELQAQVELLKNESFVNRLTEPSDDNTNNEIFQDKMKYILLGDNTTDFEEQVTEDPEVTPSVVHRIKLLENSTAENGEDEVWDHLNVVDKLSALENGTRSYEDSSGAVTPSVVERSKIAEDVTVEYQINATSVPDVDKDRTNGETNKGTEHCEKPDIKDSNLLADVVTDSNGIEYLKFGCRPIGLYVVSYLPVPPRCKGGLWIGPFPSCTKLFNETTIEAFARGLREKHTCSDDSVKLPDPTNCSQFFKCSHGKISIIPCPSGLHFNARLKDCDHPRLANCIPERSANDEELDILIPPILIEPNNVDKPGGHLGTGSTGQLIVHPRSSFSLHCLYPENIWGHLKWNVTYANSKTSPRNLTPVEGHNKLSLKVLSATENDSGIYRCLTPFGVQHAVEVVVKAVVCPEFTMEEEYEDVFYRPTPEGELRILGSRAEFQCEEGYRIFAQCMADGHWSRGLPGPEDQECTLKKKKKNGATWNCKPLDLRRHPDLILERDDTDRTIKFRCARGKRLVGNFLVRCRDDGQWTYSSLPKCEN